MCTTKQKNQSLELIFRTNIFLKITLVGRSVKPDTTKLVLALPGTTCTQCTRTHVQLSRSAYSRDRTTRTESHEELFSVKIRDSIYIIQVLVTVEQSYFLFSV